METNDEISWRGWPIEELFDNYPIYDKRFQVNVEFAENHTILFELPLNEDPNSMPVPKIDGEDIWDDNHVKLPSSKESIYYEIDSEGNKEKKYRWDLIKSSLSEKITNSHELEKCIKSYNTKFEATWKFNALHALFEDEFLEEEAEYFFEDVFPKLVEIALKLPELIRCPIPFLRQTVNHTISLSRLQCACILANAFLCTFPKRNGPRRATDYPEINFNRLYCNVGTSTIQKLKCICNYFRRVLVISMPATVLTFERRYIQPENFPKWEECDLKFSSIKYNIDSYGRIEKADGMLQMDFANRFIGGGCLGHGCVQEEIRFMINPELIVAMLFCESMKSQEAIVIYGAEQFNKYSGYSSSFKWEGNFVDDTPCDDFRRKRVYIVAIDALSFRNPYMQFDEKLIRRDVNKAFCGFYHNPSIELSAMPVSSGNWGCGSFGGFNKLKAVIQFIACVANRRNLVYYTFGDEQLVEEMHEMFTFLSANDITVGQLWNYLAIFKSHNKKFDQFYQFIYDQHEASNLLEVFVDHPDSYDMSEEIVMQDDISYQEEVVIQEEIELPESSASEKRRSQENESITETVSDSQYYENDDGSLENPSKRTKIIDDSEMTNITGMCHESNSTKTDECSKISEEHEDKGEKSNYDLEMKSSNECAEMESKLEEAVLEDANELNNDNNSSANENPLLEQSPKQNEENVSENLESKVLQKKTILDYFKPKT